jgi:hypothetical protein
MNKALRQALFLQGQDDGYLLYVDGDPVGWAQSGGATAWKLVGISETMRAHGRSPASFCFRMPAGRAWPAGCCGRY